MDRGDVEKALREIDDGTDYFRDHRQRFIESYLFLKPSIDKMDKAKVLDLGSYGHFQKLLKKLHPDMDATTAPYFDLRYPFPISGEIYDMICFMEVLEHLKDRDSAEPYNISGFLQDGVKNAMSEIARILKPRGLLFMTTPNINSWMSIYRSLMYVSPLSYMYHVKEFSVYEIHHLHSYVGMKVIKTETPNNVFGNSSVDFNQKKLSSLIDLATKAGYGSDLRGDSIFTIAVKK